MLRGSTARNGCRAYRVAFGHFVGFSLVAQFGFVGFCMCRPQSETADGKRHIGQLAEMRSPRVWAESLAEGHEQSRKEVDRRESLTTGPVDVNNTRRTNRTATE